ncbi:LysM peptidoglycan-binding domain-containing protein [Nonomuraea sp. NPDC050556]|uniref:LysM peptidoglycan-binding domain-containing protein n=1 Tax=Nonomuraea sp. NPDC050556 TaxID=3364369 RepID=UPI00378D3385
MVTVLAALSLAAFWAGAKATSWADDGAPKDHTGQPWVVVDRGDTLWKIADAYAVDGDPGKLVSEIVRLNDLDDSLIRPGTKLYLPAP